MIVYIIRDKYGVPLAVCDRKNLGKCLKAHPYGSHDGQTNDIVAFNLNSIIGSGTSIEITEKLLREAK